MESHKNQAFCSSQVGEGGEKGTYLKKIKFNNKFSKQTNKNRALAAKIQRGTRYLHCLEPGDLGQCPTGTLPQDAQGGGGE